MGEKIAYLSESAASVTLTIPSPVELSPPATASSSPPLPSSGAKLLSCCSFSCSSPTGLAENTVSLTEEDINWN